VGGEPRHLQWPQGRTDVTMSSAAQSFDILGSGKSVEGRSETSRPLCMTPLPQAAPRQGAARASQYVDRLNMPEIGS
jgi:hypothetical protein